MCLPRIGRRGISYIVPSPAAEGVDTCCMALASGVVLDGVDMATYKVDERIGRPRGGEGERVVAAGKEVVNV
jgi:hypothetical protein